MCPVCIATAAYIATGATSAGGLTALAINAWKTSRAKDGAPTTTPLQPPSKEHRS
jgi:hypothetical protein